METTSISSVVGIGSPESDLNSSELFEIVENALASVEPHSSVLAIIPDKTRDDNTDLLFPFAANILSKRKVTKFDGLVAQGTHAAMTETEKLAKIGITDGKLYEGVGALFDHQWSKPDELVTIGALAAARVIEITGGLLDKEIPLSINRLLAPGHYDPVLIFSGTLPHEVAGFAGGAKYFSPGISGLDRFTRL